VQDALPSLFEHVHAGRLTWSSWCKDQPRRGRLLQVEERGYMREGYWADLVLVDPNAPLPVSAGRCCTSAAGRRSRGGELRAAVVATIVNGEVAYENGQVNDAVRGLAFGPTR
jgi:dihydroorotase